MRGSHHVIVQNRRVRFEFSVRRNVTIVRGDSATGKTTLMSLIEAYDSMGRAGSLLRSPCHGDGSVGTRDAAEPS